MRRDASTAGLRGLEQAEADREGARFLCAGGSYHLACFVAQHVTEKVITALLYAPGEEFVLGHAVEALCRAAATCDPDCETLRESVAPLDGYDLPTRSPDSLPDSIPARVYTRAVAEDALRLTDQALHLVRTKLRREEPAAGED